MIKRTFLEKQKTWRRGPRQRSLAPQHLSLHSALLSYNYTSPMKLIVITFCFSLISFRDSLAVDDTLRPNQTLRDDGQTLVSVGEVFELGFFSPQNSKNRYVGIWFKNDANLTAFWVANRDNPLTDSSGVLTITETGSIVILNNKSENPLWASNSSAKEPILQLLDTGNLVVKQGSSENYAWQSFDNPYDSLVAGMKLGWDSVMGKSWKLTSWNSLQDPSTGIFTYEVDHRGLFQVLLRRGQNIEYRNGPWDGVRMEGDPSVTRNLIFIPIYVVNETDVYYTFNNIDNSTATMFRLYPSGSAHQIRWNRGSSQWVSVYEVKRDDCDTFNRCGVNGLCDISQSPICHCPTGFVPTSPGDWAAFDTSGGCVLRTRLNCSASEGFKKFSRLKLPYGSEFAVHGTVVNKKECELICRSNCSCVAYAVARVGGCVVWFGDLLDMRSFSDGGQDLYIRMAASEFGKSNTNTVIISVSVVISGFVLLFLVGGYIIIKKRTSRSHISQGTLIFFYLKNKDFFYLFVLVRFINNFIVIVWLYNLF